MSIRADQRRRHVRDFREPLAAGAAASAVRHLPAPVRVPVRLTFHVRGAAARALHHHRHGQRAQGGPLPFPCLF